LRNLKHLVNKTTKTDSTTHEIAVKRQWRLQSKVGSDSINDVGLLRSCCLDLQLLGAVTQHWQS